MAALARGLPAGAALGRAPASAGRAGLFAGARLPPLRGHGAQEPARPPAGRCGALQEILLRAADRKSTRLNSSHSQISYAVFCLKKKKNRKQIEYNHIHTSESR